MLRFGYAVHNACSFIPHQDEDGLWRSCQDFKMSDEISAFITSKKPDMVGKEKITLVNLRKIENLAASEQDIVFFFHCCHCDQLFIAYFSVSKILIKLQPYAEGSWGDLNALFYFVSPGQAIRYTNAWSGIQGNLSTSRRFLYFKNYYLV